jgi:cytochrome c-type biogenesis protein CcmH/NrfG
LGAFAQHHKIYQLVTLVVTAVLLSFAGQELVQTRGADGLATRVNMALQRKDYAGAIALLEKYTAANPEDDEGFYILGQTYERTDQKDKAVAAYQQALKVNPNFSEAKQALEEIQRSSGEK